MAENFYTIITKTGLAKIANAQLTSEKLDLATIVIGDSAGAYYNPKYDATALVNEVWRGGISSISPDEENPNWIIVEAVVPATVGGFTVREIGLLDTSGDMIAIGKYPQTYKPVLADGSSKDLYIRMIIEVANTSVVTLKVDPTIVIASRKYVDDKVAGSAGIIDKAVKDIADGSITILPLQTTDKTLAGAINEINTGLTDHKKQAASTTNAGHVQLSSAITSADETKAATPNAVKKVNDAVGTLAGDGNTKTVKQLADDAAAHLADDVKHGGNILGASINSNVKTEGMLMQYQNGLWGAYDPHPLASIGFRGILYDKGIEHIPIEIGYESGIGSQIKNSDHLFMQANSVDGTTRTYVIGEPIDLTHINVLKADWTVQGDSVSVGGTGRFYVSTTKLASSGSTIYTKQTIPEVREIAELNVATLNGLHYVMVQAYDTSGAKRNSRVKAYKIWGE